MLSLVHNAIPVPKHFQTDYIQTMVLRHWQIDCVLADTSLLPASHDLPQLQYANVSSANLKFHNIVTSMLFLFDSTKLI